MRNLKLLFLFLLGACPALAQLSNRPTTDTIRAASRNFTADDGLGGATITSLQHDNRGFLWVGTPDELLIYDGRQFLPFRYRDSLGASQPFQRAVILPIAGGFLIFHDKGVQQFIAATGTLLPVSFPVALLYPPSDAELHPSAQYPGWYRFICSQAEGWYQPMQRRWVLSRLNPEVSVTWSVNASWQQRKIYCQGNADGTHFRFWEPVSHKPIDRIEYPFPCTSPILFPTGSIILDARDWRSLWWVPSAGVPRPIGHIADPSSRLNVYTTDSSIYLAVGHELFFWDGKTPMLVPIRGPKGELVLHKGNVTQFLQDGSTLWMGSNTSGLLRLSLGGAAFSTIQSDMPEFNLVQSILPDIANNRIYIGSYYGPLAAYDTNGRFVEDLTPAIRGESGYWSAYINRIERWTDGWLLIFGSDTKIGLLNPQTRQFISLEEQMSKEMAPYHLLAPDFPGRKTVRKSGPNSWWMTGLYAIEKWSLEGSGNSAQLHLDQRINIPFKWPEGICEYAGSLWCAGAGKLYRLAAGKVADSFLLPLSALVTNMQTDSAGRLWIATEGGMMIWQNGKVQHTLSTENGLPNNHVYYLLPDRKGWIWGSTNNGLFAVNSSDYRVRIFGKSDGLQGAEFNGCAAAVDQDGRFYFGGVNGVNSFFPDRVLHATANGIVTITRIATPDSVYYAYPNGLLPTDIRLPYGQAILRLDFTLAEPDQGTSLHYQYRLSSDGAWTDAGMDGHLQLSLAPGSYQVEIRLRDQSSTPARLHIEVTPPFYKQSRYQLLMFVLLVAAVAGFFILRSRKRYRHRMNVLEAESAIQREKERISRELHDELGARAAVMAHNAAQLENGSNDPKSAPIAGRIRQDATEMLTALRETVWTLKQQNISLEALWLRYKNFFSKMAATYGHIQFSLSQEEEMPERIIESDKALNLLRILQEATTNAIRHSGGTEIAMTITREQQDILFTLRDNGNGFDENEARENDRGNGLQNMYYRAKESNLGLLIRSGAGTGVLVQVRLS